MVQYILRRDVRTKVYQSSGTTLASLTQVMICRSGEERRDIGRTEAISTQGSAFE